MCDGGDLCTLTYKRISTHLKQEGLVSSWYSSWVEVRALCRKLEVVHGELCFHARHLNIIMDKDWAW